MIIEQIIKQTRFYLDPKSFTYHNFFHKINQNNGKKERAGEGIVGAKKAEELGVLDWVGIWKKEPSFLFKVSRFPSEKWTGSFALNEWLSCI